RSLSRSVALGAIIIASTVTFGDVHGQLGVTAGLNFAELDDIDAGDRHATFDNSTGWHLHLWFDLPIGPVAIRPGIRYTDMGDLLDGATIDDLPSISDDESLRLIEIPV